MLRARVSFFVGNRPVSEGDQVPESDPIVKGREALFGPSDLPVVEQATAAPGEVRAAKPRKATAKKAQAK